MRLELIWVFVLVYRVNGISFLSRREVFVVPPLLGVSSPVMAKCLDIDSCREQGEIKFEELERKAGPTISLGQGLRYREMERGSGPVLRKGDATDIRFQVLKGNGDFLYGVPNREPGGTADLSETLRVNIGSLDVPLGVEEALVGAAKGTRRRVELPPTLGFASSDWNPMPEGYAGKQRMKRFRNLFDSNPGYQPVLLFEFEVVRVRPAAAARRAVDEDGTMSSR